VKSIEAILKGIRPEFEFGEGKDFIAEGMLDSFDVVTLVSELDKTFNISIDGTDILPENLGSIAAIRTLLAKYGVRP
jgi:acyl carrier protein